MFRHRGLSTCGQDTYAARWVNNKCGWDMLECSQAAMAVAHTIQ